MPKSKKRKKANAKSVAPKVLPEPLIPADVDLRDVPIPVDLFVEMAMSQFGIGRDEATKLVLETIARRHGAKGNA